MIEDFDGYLIKVARQPEGLDFNRNFPFQWRPEGEQQGAGPYPASEPEIKALVDFIVAHPNINVGLTYHTYSRVILRPFSTKADEEMETDDRRRKGKPVVKDKEPVKKGPRVSSKLDFNKEESSDEE